MGKGNGKRQMHFFQAAAIGLGVSLVLGGGLILLFARLLSAEKIGEGSIGLLAAAVLLLSAPVGEITAVRMLGKQKLPVSMAVSGSLLALLVISGAAFFGGGFYGLPIGAGIILGSGLAVGLVAAGRKGSGKRRYKGYKLK